MYKSILSINQKPQAIAIMKGNNDYKDISGTVRFYQRQSGVLVISQIFGLPKGTKKCDSPILAFHIHSGTSCTGDTNDYFADSKGHFNPNDCPHPYHAGDMPPLFSCGGYAFSAFFTDRFTVKEIIGRTVIIHSGADDFTSQPAGNPGVKIACGVIKVR